MSRLINRSTDRCKPFFDFLRWERSLSELENAIVLFEPLKTQLSQPTLLSKVNANEKLSIDPAVSKHALSIVLNIEEDGIQYPVDYLSKALHDIYLRYSLVEKHF